MVSGVDGLLRCCLRGQQPHAAAVLSTARGLLQQQEQWAEHGYRSSGGGSPDRALAVLLLFNSQLAALAGAAVLGCGVGGVNTSRVCQRRMSSTMCAGLQ